MDFQVLSSRLMRLARLDTSVFDEVRLDASATIPSVVVAVAATFLAGLGGLLWWMRKFDFDEGKVFTQSFIIGSLISIGLWLAWMLVTHVVLTQVFKEQSDPQQLLRTMGLAAAPLALSVLLFIPAIEYGIGLASIGLFFGLTNIAVQSSTTAKPPQVLVANLAGFAVWAVILSLFIDGDTSMAPGMFIFAPR